MKPYTMRDVSKHPARLKRRRDLNMQSDLFVGDILKNQMVLLRDLHGDRVDYWRGIYNRRFHPEQTFIPV